MAKRTFIKAYGDIVGGIGNDVSISHEVSRKPSTMKLSSKDVSRGMRQAVEIKTVEMRQIPRCPLQAAHMQRKNAPIQEEVGKTNYFNIDGDESTAAKWNESNEQQAKAVPQTIYKTRSFMSSVDLSPSRKAQKPKTVNHRNLDPPSWSPEKPKVSEAVRMFLPKGIDSKDKPYIAPKFMPSYRDMMAPKPKPDPLVSIVEKTPPSMQKWAIEYNAEPKHNISIAELQEDIIRETAEKARAPKENISKGQSTSGTRPSFHQAKDKINEAKDEPSHIPEQTEVGHSIIGTVGKYQANGPGSGQYGPWSNVHIPTEFDPSRPKDPNVERSLGKPLVDWVPPRFITTNHLPNHEYSFKDAIAQGLLGKGNTPKPNDKSELPILKSEVNSVYFDTEEQRFHKWFKERMSAAVQSAVDNQPIKSCNTDGSGQANQPDAKSISKLEYSSNVTNPIAQTQIIEAKDNAANSGTNEDKPYTVGTNNFTTSIGMIPPVAPNYPKLSNKALNASYEPERGSSFCQWLKLRGHPVVKKELDPPDSKESSEKIITSDTPQKNTKFPWSLSYTLRKKTSSKVIPKRLAKNISKSHKSMSQNDRIGQMNKPKTTDNVNRGSKKSLRKSGTFHKTLSNRSMRGTVKKPVRSETKVPVGRSMDEIPQTDVLRQVASIGNAYPGLFGDKPNTYSEVDHVNNMRKADIVGSSKTTSLKKQAGSQMKYWESKYSNKPKSAQNPNLSKPQTPGSRTKTTHNWYRSKMSTEGIKSVFIDSLAAKDAETDRLTFSSIEEVPIPSDTNGNQLKDQVMYFSDDFDVDGFLCEEESTEKQLLDDTRKSDRTPDEEPQGAKGREKAIWKLPVQESLELKRFAQVHPQGSSDKDAILRQRVQQKLDKDELVLAFGEDPGLEDMQWSEFIGPRNSLDGDADLTRLLPKRANHISSEQDSCL